MNEELTKALEGLKTELTGKTETEVKAAIEAFEEKHKESLKEDMKSVFNDNIKQVQQDLANQIKAQQEHLDKLDIKVNKPGIKEADKETFDSALVKAIESNFEGNPNEGVKGLKDISSSHKQRLQLKVMTVAANLTGDSVITYRPGLSPNPAQVVNFMDLVQTVQSATGTYVLYREVAPSNGAGIQTVPGDPKTEIDFNYEEITFVANYINAFSRYAKQMAQDLPFLTTFLPQQLRREYFFVENSTFYTDLSTAATPSTADPLDEIPVRIIEDLGALENANFIPNGIVINPVRWATVASTQPNDFSLPGVVSIINGNMTINGVPVFKASWVPLDEYIVGDWTQAFKVVTDGLAVEFFEQDSDNVQRNLITARVESRTVLAIGRPDAFILGDSTPIP